MRSENEDSGLVEDFIIPLPSLMASTSPGIIYVSFTRENPDVYATASFQCTLKFISKEMDPSTGEPEEEGYEDEYQLEDLELAAGGDWIIPSYSTFGSEWDRLRSGPNATETYALSAMDSIKGMSHLSHILHIERSSYGASSSSCLRFDHRGPEHGTPWWNRGPIFTITTHTAIVWIGCWRRWQSLGPMPNDILPWRRRHSRVGCTRGKARSLRPCIGCGVWMMTIRASVHSI